jgi:Tol biopolymer transport system component/imidazolonepropionase-like amidohydrolase
MRINVFIKVLSVFVLPNMLMAQQPKEDKWDVNNPPGTYKQTNFTVNEGTWMNLDISPDGKTIVFDLLGDIYTLPISGGKAKVLRQGHAYEVQPRFSQDGKMISYTSDAGGGDNIWVMGSDGSNPRQITKEDFRLLNNAVWSPDGKYLVARKHFTSGRSLGAGELWMYHMNGGDGIQLNKRKNDQQDLGEPCWSADGRFIYFSEDVYPGGYFQYNKDPNSQIYVIKRYDTHTGEIDQVTGGSGGAVRPQISRDGKRLAFVRRVREESVLFIRDLNTGEEWPVFSGLSKDQQEAWAIFGVYTNFNWTPDDKEIIIWAGGKIKRINIETLAVNEIPFEADCSHRIYDALRFKQTAAPDSFVVKAIRQTVTSPDEKHIVFNAAGYLWKKNLPDGKPSRITNGSDFEFEPSFSADGKSIVYVTWSDENHGSISVIPATGGKPQKITKEKAIYRTPRYSPDGKWIVYEKENGNDHQGFTHCVDPGIYMMSATGGAPQRIIKNGSNPFFSKDGKRIFFIGYENGGRALKSIGVDGLDELTHFTGKFVTSMVPSPDNNWVAFIEYHKVYIAAFAPSGKPIEISSGLKAVPVAQTARDNGLSLQWSTNSQKLFWTSGDEYFVNNINQRFKFLEGAPDSLPPPDTSGIKIGLILPHDKPAGMIAITGARIITMDAERKIIENGTIIINQNRIQAVGNSSLEIPKGAFVLDAKGKTIVPGFIDVHAHLGTFRQGLSPQKQWSYYANLAYGITTTHDPSSNSEMVFSQSEMVKYGSMTGPRVFSTGWILYGAEGDYRAIINKPADAMSAIQRTLSFGAFSVKSYNQPRREQRQMVIDAARKTGTHVYPEGGSFFFHNLSMILDGHTGIEHNLPIATLHGDVINLFKASKTAITPTLIVSYGSVSGEYFFYQEKNIWENKKLMTFTPRFIIDSRARHRTMIPLAEYDNGHILVSRSLKRLADAGVRVNMGSHGQIQGIGAHWEMWMLSQGGMSNMQVLECATLNGAHYIGMEQDLGSIEQGKLADLVILDKNPLDDIRNTETVAYTVANGRLFDANSMNEIGNSSNKRGKFYWEMSKTGSSFPWHMNAHGQEEQTGVSGCCSKH